MDKGYLMTSCYSKSAVAWGDDFPLYVSHGDGSHLFTVDGAELVDFSMALGCCPLGYRHPTVDAAIRRQLDSGISFSLGTAIEAELCELLATTFGPHVVGGDDAMVALGKNGSDATALAVRLARTVKDGLIHMHPRGYHGWHDWSLHDSPRGIGTATPAGVGDRWSAAIIEPDLEGDRYCQNLRDSCDRVGALLIFDECVTGLRYPGLCAAAHFGIKPDLLCLGKGLANGMPISAVIGRREIMERIAPGNKPNCFWSATHFGETLSIAAAIATLRYLLNEHYLLRMKSDVAHCVATEMLNDIPWVRVGEWPLSRLSFEPHAYARAFRREMARNGVLIYSAHNVSTVHSPQDFNRLRNAYRNTVDCLLQVGDEPEPQHTVMRR
jgi:glutamate-1-semialdehyde 2,1-aminomutase